MRKTIYHCAALAAITLAVSCGESNKTVAVEQGTDKSAPVSEQIPTEPEPIGVEINVSKEAIKSAVNYLASDALQGRATGTEGIDKAASYIEGVFSKQKIRPYFSSFRDTFFVDGKEAFNVVGLIEGNDPQLKDEFIVLGAHYDHIGTAKAVDGDEIANGANDNATGTAALLEVAKYFAKHKTNKRSILIAFFSAEELGLKGSDHLAKKLKAEGMDIYTMLNFEMLGIPMQGKPYEAYLTGYERSNFADLFNLYAGAEVFGFLPQAKQYSLFQRSDNYPFFKEFNIPAQTLSTFDFTNYDYYHHVDDEPELMDFNHMANLVGKVIPGIEGMANTLEKEIKMN